MRALLFLLMALSTASASPTAKYLVESEGTGIIVSPFNRSKSSFRQISTFWKRWDGSPAMGEEYAKAKNKGCTLWSMMHIDDAKAGKLFNPPRVSAHSDYLKLDDLRAWGYITKTPRKNPKCDMGNDKDMFGMQAVLQAKGISANKKDWKCVRITHGDPEHKTIDLDNQAYTNPRGHTVRVTGALFHFAINEKDGVLVIAKQYSIAYQSQYRRPPVAASDFPDLRSSSDLAWLAWKPSHDKGVRLNRIFTWSITNGGTQRLMAAALEDISEDKTLKPYPWVSWLADQGSGSLILGSPNGLGIGYLLAQHKPELGNKRVRKFEAFLADTAASSMHEPTLHWEIEDSPADRDDPMET